MVKGTIKNLIFDLGGVVIRFDGEHFMNRSGHMQECTIGENEDEWQPDNFPVEENGDYNYGVRVV